MNFSDVITSSLLGVRAHKLRSTLTTIGIIIGVGTVVSMVSIIEGVNRFVYRAFGEVGSNVVYIQKWKWSVVVGGRGRGWWREISKRKDLTLEDAGAISQLPSVEIVSPTYPIFGSYDMKYQDKKMTPGDITGVTPEHMVVSGYSVAEGRNFISADNDFRRKVCIIGPYIKENLFENQNPIGEEIILAGRRFTVIGVTEEKGEMLGNNLDNLVMIPLSTSLTLFKNTGDSEWRKVFQSLRIQAKIKEGYSLEKAQEEIRHILRLRRNIPFTEEDDFALNTQAMLFELYRNVTMGIFLAMIGIASLALIVGGIGIMNIMLVSVSERTREIGIRMAVGAKRKDILFQFLGEAIILTAVGATLGLILGIGIAKLVDFLTPLPSDVPVWSVLLAIGFSTVVGVFFGIYPATKASKMDPIQALKYE